MFFLRNHRLADVPFTRSPHADARPADAAVDCLVIHGISLPPGQFGGDEIRRLFTGTLDPAAHPYFREIEGLEVSAHVVVYRDGSVEQFVPFDQRAWHAGKSEFCGKERCNDFSIGIELEGLDDLAYEDAQYRTLVGLVAAIRQGYPGITPERIVGHSDIAPGRKTDPGPAFDWARFRHELSMISSG